MRIAELISTNTNVPSDAQSMDVLAAPPDLQQKVYLIDMCFEFTKVHIRHLLAT
jgi:hypothetical protein